MISKIVYFLNLLCISTAHDQLGYQLQKKHPASKMARPGTIHCLALRREGDKLHYMRRVIPRRFRQFHLDETRENASPFEQ